jgi:hypothetical protein
MYLPLYHNQKTNKMKEVKIIPLVLSVCGLISIGSLITELLTEFNIELFIGAIYGFVVFVFMLLLSVDIFNKDTKIVP